MRSEQQYMPCQDPWANQQSVEEIQTELREIERRLKEDSSQEPLTFAERERLKARRDDLKRQLQEARKGEFHGPSDSENGSRSRGPRVSSRKAKRIRREIGVLKRQVQELRDAMERSGKVVRNVEPEFAPVRPYWEKD